ncbi:MAG: hypothetical protein V4508_26795 [Pseudomonadota bacterium]
MAGPTGAWTARIIRNAGLRQPSAELEHAWLARRLLDFWRQIFDFLRQVERF